MLHDLHLNHSVHSPPTWRCWRILTLTASSERSGLNESPYPTLLWDTGKNKEEQKTTKQLRRRKYRKTQRLFWQHDDPASRRLGEKSAKCFHCKHDEICICALTHSDSLLNTTCCLSQIPHHTCHMETAANPDKPA